MPQCTATGQYAPLIKRCSEYVSTNEAFMSIMMRTVQCAACYTCAIRPKRVASGEAHLRGLARRQYHSKEMSALCPI